MHVLFVNPPLYDFAALDLWAKPLGLLYLAAAARQCGCDVSLLDFLDVHAWNQCDADAGVAPPVFKRFGTAQYPRQPVACPLPLRLPGHHYQRYGISRAHALELLACKPAPDLVVVTSPFTYTYPGMRDAIAIIRTAFPRVPVWLGGIYAQLCPEHARRHAGADTVITEPDLSAFVARLAAFFPRVTVPPHQFAHIADWPAPALDLYPALSYIPLRLSRGCVNACAYCAAPYLCPHFEERDAERAAAELLAICARTGARDIAFYDDALLANAEPRLLPFLRRVCAVRRDLRWHTPNGMHLRLITDELAGQLRAAGFVTLRFGLESANYARIASTGAKYVQRDVARCVQALLRAGFDLRMIGVYILMGLPGQSLEEVRDTIRFVRDTCGITAKLAEYSPVPHSALWPAAVADTAVPLADEPLWHNNSLLPLRSRVFTSDAIAELRALAAR